ncbi:MAG TPA: FAD-binding and (Fe-S)-binding domain-containing protein [Bacteroidales bacterium]|jgi:D-lactate dehydrogenase|nr:FAD-binding and (Fe-S)-binding domain-containing protein [Bacteroidales bacterium]HPY22602.1 FAD-binding and (Fe-S)-binding domain-containing protein [Bacteroidales bacterium]HQA93552.1 FAD-binding and (Fe-S)-binding domain-containing protein [Bacteroidales bacterium]
MIAGKYKEFYDKLKSIIPEKRMLHDPLSTLAFGTDASFYRLIPKLVIKAHSEEEIVAILTTAYNMGLPVTFRAAGTSLSGQAISDSILVLATHGWKEHKILDHGLKILLQPGIRGAAANRYLAPYGRKIGPDPASIDAAMIGGIVANNASGMCCGVADNSYKTVADIRVILPDGTLLDTADEASVRSFKESHKDLLRSLEKISADIAADKELKERIIKKYKIKNTNGYSLNAFTDYSDGIDILKHLIIGSEGTLAFISSITYNTVVEHPHKALAMVVFTSIKDACTAAQILKKQKASAVELIDRTGVRSADKTPGIPEYLKTIGEESCVLLVETRAASAEELKANVESVTASISHIPTELPYTFTTDAKEQAMLWKIRKELFPTVAGLRKSGTTAIIEDICFPIDKLAEATMKLREIFERDGYGDAVIFGHAMDGNLHFVFNQNFSEDKEVEKYRIFMEDITKMVVSQYDGSLKAEHGTGRNMAPFLEMEWGREAYRLMKEVKDIFDPKGILNPGVIINADPKAHISNLKPIPSTREVVDKCMECGFCEGHCVAEGLTLSPRQRVAVFREIENLKRTGEEPHRAAEMQKLFRYAGEQTCATDSLCHLNCPVKADTGKLIKEIRHEIHSPKGEKRALKIAGYMGSITAFMRGGLKLLHGLRFIFGKKLFGALARGIRAISFKLIPLWNEHMPTGANKIKKRTFPEKELKVVYFPSCITRSMGTSKSYSKEKEITRMTEALLTAAGYQIIYPENMDKLCCGMLFSSKGYVEAGKKSSDELKAALLKASGNGKYPVLCDMSPCLYTMRTNMEGELKLYEPAEFIDNYLLDRLELKPVDEKVAIFAVCSAKNLAVESHLENVARKCAREVVIVDSNCCGFAGDRGFFFPELNEHGLRDLKRQSEGCDHGYATSRTCEIGLSRHSGIEFKSIIYLAAKAAGIDTSK